jgi:hypothetical protein
LEFTTCSKTGRVGPSQAQCNTAYQGNNLAGQVTVTAGVQRWTVPGTGNYLIEVNGAQGADNDEGFGARMIGTFALTQGQVVKIVVGQRGGRGNGPEASGGGGSFVALDNNTALVVAGGGGSRRNAGSGIRRVTTDGHVGSAGRPGFDGVSLGNGGVDGSGGTTIYVGTHGGGGGAGFSGDGSISADNRGACTPGNAITPQALIRGAVGGWTNFYTSAAACSSLSRMGGFGGGAGGGHGGAGGAGGYSGGGSDNNSGWSGGGGSINNGSNQSNTTGASSGDGSVTIRPN